MKLRSEVINSITLTTIILGSLGLVLAIVGVSMHYIDREKERQSLEVPEKTYNLLPTAVVSQECATTCAPDLYRLGHGICYCTSEWTAVPQPQLYEVELECGR